MKSCEHCDGDGYTEKFNDEFSDVIIELCKACDGTGVERAGIEL